MMPQLRGALWVVAMSCWVAAVAWGMAVTRRYESTPGQAAKAPLLWPEQSLIQRGTDRPTLLMMVHPQCSCTLASLNELDAIMNRVRNRITALVVFVQPDEAQSGVENSMGWAQALRIPGTTAIVDRTGAEAARFGTFTSGEVLVYDQGGHLAFSGGVTAARGHEGDNVGRQEVLAALEDPTQKRVSHEVYGCPL